MTESDLRAVLLLRAVERAAPQGWSFDDGQWAGREARRRLGEQASAEAWLVQRARLGEHGLPLPLLGGAASAGRRWAAALLLALAALLGALGDALGGGQVINLLAPPLLVLLAWNLGVYALLLGAALRRGVRRGTRSARDRGAHPPPAGAWWFGPLRRGWLAWWRRCSSALGWAAPHPLRASPFTGRPGAGLADVEALWLGFGRDWWLASAPLQTARLAAVLHAAAALLALGALLSLYGRGLVLDYRAGWDSTFLGPAAVQRMLVAVLGPASALSGLVLPDLAGVAGLRLAGGAGESAARWIHLWALTLGWVVVLPRALLAALALLRARALAASLPLPVAFDDLQTLLRSASGQPLPVAVLAYSYTLDGPRQAQLPRVLGAQFGPGVQLHYQALPMGAEDDLPRWLAAAAGTAGAAPQGAVVALFALTATPERETHGALLQALAEALPAATERVVMVDESDFRARFVGPDGAERRAQRRAAWSALLQDSGQTACFIDLSDAVAGRHAAAGDDADPLRRGTP